MYQGGSDSFIGPRDAIPLPSDDWGIDFEAEIAVITDDVPMHVTPEKAAGHIKLLMLVNDVSLRGLIPGELAKGFGFFQSKPSSAFFTRGGHPGRAGRRLDRRQGGPAAVINPERRSVRQAGSRRGYDLQLPHPGRPCREIQTARRRCDHRIGHGLHKENGNPGRPVKDGGLGYSCIAEIRMIETINDGKPTTGFMKFGDRVAIEMKDKAGQSVFGRIDQEVVRYKPAD